MLADRVRDLRQPCPVLGEFQDFQRREIFDAIGLRAAQGLAQSSTTQPRHIMRLAIQPPSGLPTVSRAGSWDTDLATALDVVDPALDLLGSGCVDRGIGQAIIRPQLSLEKHLDLFGGLTAGFGKDLINGHWHNQHGVIFSSFGNCPDRFLHSDLTARGGDFNQLVSDERGALVSLLALA